VGRYWSVEECGWVECPSDSVVARVPEQVAAPSQEQLPESAPRAWQGGSPET
jgi:hypothetical protein